MSDETLKYLDSTVLRYTNHESKDTYDIDILPVFNDFQHVCTCRWHVNIIKT